MPPARKTADLGGLRADWVRRVAQDPKEPADAQALTGYLGDSAKDDHHRLYLDLDLSSYVDIPAEDVVHGQRVRDDSSLGEVVVWVRRNARLSYGPAAQAGGMFAGPIGDQFGGLGGYPGPITLPPMCPIRTLPIDCWPPKTLPWTGCPVTQPPICFPPPPTPRCPTLPWTGCPRTTLPHCFHTVIDCPPRTPVLPCIIHTVKDCPVRSLLVPCITRDAICHTPICPVQSAPVACQTMICPSAVDACPSAPGGCDTPITPQTPVINPAGYFGGGLGGAYGYGG